MHENPTDLTFLADFPLKYDYGDLYVFPGVIDSNFHTHSTLASTEGIKFHTGLAAAGGTTFVVENCQHEKDFSDNLEEKLSAYNTNALTDYSFLIGVSSEEGQNLEK